MTGIGNRLLKRYISLLLMIGFAVLVVGLTNSNKLYAQEGNLRESRAQEAATLSIDPADKLLLCKSSGIATVSVQDINDLFGYQLQLNYDPALVKPTVTFDNTFFDTSVPGESFAFVTCGADSCTAVASKLAPAVPISGGGPLLTVALEPLVGAGSYEMGLSNIIFSDIDGFEIDISGPPETLTVSTCGLAQVGGTVLLEGRATPVTNGVVTLDHTDGIIPVQQIIFDAENGSYVFSDVPFWENEDTRYRIRAAHDLYLSNEGSFLVKNASVLVPPTRLLGGDADLNSQIDIIDLGCIGAHFGPGQFVCAGRGSSNINGDSETNIQDLALAGRNYFLNGFLPW